MEPKTNKKIRARKFDSQIKNKKEFGMAEERKKEVAFASKELKEAFEKLKERKFEETQLYEFIEKAIDELKNNPLCGIRIPSNLIPKEYIQKFEITNLYKYNLPDAWRLLYTLIGNEVKIVSMIIEWLNHKNYERRFNY